MDFFFGFFPPLDFLGRGAGFSSSSDESGMGGGVLPLGFLGRGAGFSSSSDESGGGVFLGGDE